MPTLTILGGGFAGVWAAMSAAAERDRLNAPVTITLISDGADLIIRPRLYETPSPDMCVPLAPLMSEIDVALHHDQITAIDPAGTLTGGTDTPVFDRLILATGSQLIRPPIPGIDHAHSVDSYDAALRLDAHLGGLSPEMLPQTAAVVIGAGSTGLELATELRKRLPQDARITLIDRIATPGAALGPTLAAPIAEALKTAGIETQMGQGITHITADTVTLSDGTVIAAHTIALATGFTASPLTASLGVEILPDGRLPVAPDLRVTGADAIFAAGDTARGMTAPDRPALMTCQHAIPMGQTAGRNAIRDLMGLPTSPYAQPFYATCVDLGPWGAVFTTGWARDIGKTGAEGKEMKDTINRQWIYPPDPAIGRAAIFARIRGDKAT